MNLKLFSKLLLQITIDAMKSDIDEVRLQGIEFWSNVCDEEMDLAIEASEVKYPVCKFEIWMCHNFVTACS